MLDDKLANCISEHSNIADSIKDIKVKIEYTISLHKMKVNMKVH